ncbi:YhfH family protein [Bacillus sp. RG28]|uniref:YhfH family protein n=1 Tax=Gottfriedia endophytica TaxID=2820819 RepID=A0A940SIJ0_9BACI|nr:protein YhfH [Gottfriedia endophytica]MBP0724531.1 YhfH family protein [Gottfriedia endophytica]
MLQKMSEFLKSLPKKKCANCGTTIEEQHDCYHNTCSNCLKNTF